MKTTLQFFLICFLLSTTNLFATHTMGADIIYRCLGNSKYAITLKVYRDCNGIQPSQSTLTAGSNGDTIRIINQTKVSVRDVTGVGFNCPISSRCNGGSYAYGIEEHVWEMQLDLSAYTHCDWKLSWQHCCRNSNISTGAADQNFYTEVSLNNCLTQCNNSPVFELPPVHVICTNVDFYFNSGAIDTIDIGDSLSYELVAGLQAPNTPITYNGQYSPDKPLTFYGFPNVNLSWPAGFRLNPINGDLQFRPTGVNQVAIIAIEVKEWRRINGVMTIIGTSRRDMQVVVVNCPNNKIPRITPPYTRYACAGQQVCVDINTIDDDAGDSVRISWSGGIPGATFTNTNGIDKLARGQVCWTPQANQISTTPYVFFVTATDNACPLTGVASRAFSIFVRPEPKGFRTIQNLGCGKVSVNFSPDTSFQNFNLNWKVLNNNSQQVFSSTKLSDSFQLSNGLHRIILEFPTTSGCGIFSEDTITISGVTPPAFQVRDSTLIPLSTTVYQLKNKLILPFTTFGVGTPDWISLDGNPILDNSLDKTDIHDIKLNTSNLTRDSAYFLIAQFTSSTTGCSNSDTAYIKMVMGTGVSANGLSGMQLFPNPSSGLVYLKLEQPQWNGELCTLKVYSIEGKLVHSESFTWLATENKAINISSLAAGSYVMEVNSKLGSIRGHLIKE